MTTKQTIIETLFAIDNEIEESVDLDMGYCQCRIRSNSKALLDKLSQYFSFVVKPISKPTYIIHAFETAPIALPVAFVDWKREPGKTGKKDSYVDLDDARLIRKVRTGMVFLQSVDTCIAAGPCLANDNQVINFITSQMMNWFQQHNWLICHAAAVVYGGQAYAVAGFSGGGKSSLMLTMLEKSHTSFLTNDRLFIKDAVLSAEAGGIPKMPRINPGTIVNNERLAPLIDAQQREALLALPDSELWNLEQKYDADIERFYGAGRIRYRAPLKALLILNWSRDSEQGLDIKPVNLRERPELLQAVMKSPGPFYQDKQGQFISDEISFDEQAYLAVFEHIKVYEATGKVDFDELAQRYLAM